MTSALSEAHTRKGYSHGSFIYMYISFKSQEFIHGVVISKILNLFYYVFKAHEEFVLLAGKAYLLVLAMKMFNMENLEDLPKHPLLKDNIKYMQNKPKEKIFDALMEEILDSSFAPFQLDVCGPCTYMYIQLYFKLN